MCCASDRVAEIEAQLALTNPISVSFRNGDVSESEPGIDDEWATTQIIALLPSHTDLRLTKTKLKKLGCHHFQTRTIEESDWSQKLSKPKPNIVVGPFVIGDSLPIVKPPHIPLQIPAGLAFGTGEHETTVLCLEWLARQELGAKHLLDLGCGSGILAIAAMKLGAESAIAVDNDPNAIVVAEENALQNDVRISFSNQLDLERRFDVVVCNIYADTLIAYASQVEYLLKPHGLLALSGILESQIKRVQRAYASIKFNPTAVRNDWALLMGSKQSTEKIIRDANC